jgi:neurotransmitter:Na+ symporter, NSS family
VVEKKQWSSNLLFLITAIGTEAGIANFWKFTYLAGQNGGATFVFVYFAALATLAVPALIAEMLIGRYCGRSVAGCMRVLVDRDKVSPAWKSYGVIALAGIFLVLSFYFVVCGWMLRYFLLGVTGSFANIRSPQAVEMYGSMMASPVQMLACSGFFILLTSVVVAHGVNKGIERVSGILTPLRFLILIGLCGYASVVGNTVAAARFLLSFHIDRLSADVVVIAVGQAFFSLGVGAGVLMTVGAYMKREYSIVKSVFTVAFAQGLVAVLAGFSIFPLVFAYGLEATHGPGLVFVTLPVAFGQMPYGGVFGTIMFLVLSFAGLTATIVLLEAIVAFLEEYTRHGYLQHRACDLAGGIHDGVVLQRLEELSPTAESGVRVEPDTFRADRLSCIQYHAARRRPYGCAHGRLGTIARNRDARIGDRLGAWFQALVCNHPLHRSPRTRHCVSCHSGMRSLIKGWWRARL